MAERSIAAGSVRSHAKTLRASLDGLRAGDANVRMSANSFENRPEYRDLVREAMRRVGRSQKAFAIEAGQSESVISEAFHGKRALDVEWVWAQDAPFQRALRQVEDEANGIDPRAMRRESFDDFVEFARRFWMRHERREERVG